MRIYTAGSSGGQGGISSGVWPVLRSRTETKHLSGLLSVSAEFIRPVGDTSLPTSIPTSIGGVTVYPLPTVSKDTSDFEKINATGYKVWDTSMSEEVFNISVYDMPVYYYFQTQFQQSGQVYTDGNTITMRVVIESGWVKKIGTNIPQLSRALSIISPQSFSVTIPNGSSTGGPLIMAGTPVLDQVLTMVKHNKYGTVTESEAAYSIAPYMDLGIVKTTIIG